jgi:hypothetical protein
MFSISKGKIALGKFAARMFSTTSSGCHFIQPKLYADVNLNREKDYHDFENMKLKLG